MSTITKFDKANLKMLRGEMDAALASVLAKHGLSVKLGNIRFGAEDFTVKLEVGTTGPAGDTSAADERKFKQYAWKFGIDENAFGTTFTSNGKTFTIAGINPKAKAYPIIATSGGKRFKFAPERAGLSVDFIN